MLPFEDENREKLAKAFSRELECARDVLVIGQEVGETLTQLFQENDRVDPRTAIVVQLLFAQTLRRCRTAVLVWQSGYMNESDILARSLFDAHLAARFVMEPQLPQLHWSDQLRREFDLLCDLSGPGISRFTEMGFRATLYAACHPLKLDKKTERLKSLAGFPRRLPAEFGVKMQDAAADAESMIGSRWAERIRRTGKFHGFGQIKLLAEYCGADKSHYYQTLYGMQSGSTHAESAMLLIRQPTASDLRRSLCIPCAILGESIDDFNRVFALGFAERLRTLAGRLEQVFGVERRG